MVARGNRPADRDVGAPRRRSRQHWPASPRSGRPPEHRRAPARALVGKAVLGIPTTSALIERLAVDKSLRRICGWERRA